MWLAIFILFSLFFFFPFQYIIKVVCCHFPTSRHHGSVEIAFRNNRIFFSIKLPMLNYISHPFPQLQCWIRWGGSFCIMKNVPLISSLSLRKILWIQDSFIKRTILLVWKVLQQFNEVKKYCSLEYKLHWWAEKCSVS